MRYFLACACVEFPSSVCACSQSQKSNLFCFFFSGMTPGIVKDLRHFRKIILFPDQTIALRCAQPRAGEATDWFFRSPDTRTPGPRRILSSFLFTPHRAAFVPCGASGVCSAHPAGKSLFPRNHSPPPQMAGLRAGSPPPPLLLRSQLSSWLVFPGGVSCKPKVSTLRWVPSSHPPPSNPDSPDQRELLPEQLCEGRLNSGRRI